LLFFIFLCKQWCFFSTLWWIFTV